MCLDYNSKFTNYVFLHSWEPLIFIGIIALAYGLTALYFYISRNKVSFMTRSPLTIAISLLTLCIDSIINTLIFSEITIGNVVLWQCDLGIVATVMGQFGFQLAIGVRIYRVSQVYRKYLNYLDNQKKRFTRTINTDPGANSNEAPSTPKQ